MNSEFVSLIIPTYNEGKYLLNCLNSILHQTYPKEKIEILIIDGGSTDGTHNIINAFVDILPIRKIHNKDKKTTFALNMGIKEAVGEIILRLDAHAEYDCQYVEKCVYYLNNIDAQNVGGVATTRGHGFWGRINAEILSSPFGVGNSKFRTGSESGYVDTVPFGAFRKSLIEKIGLFDNELSRSEDNDFNSRIRAAGGKVYLASDIKFTYFCRDTLKGLFGQAIKNGNALFITMRKNPSAMSLRHFIPFLFLLSLVVLPPLCFNTFFKISFICEIVLYLILDIYFSFFCGKLKYSFIRILLYPLFHMCYGIGSLIGLFNLKLY